MADFGTELIKSGDVDPIYPILRYVNHRRCETADQSDWLTALYLAFYNLPSAMAAYRMNPNPYQPLEMVDLRWPIGMERRGLRGGRIVHHIADLQSKVYGKGLLRWAQADWTKDPHHNFECFWKQSQTIWGNGRWAAFKWAELLGKVHGWLISAPDMRLDDCRSPREALCEHYGVPIETPTVTLNKMARQLWCELAREGCPVQDLETLETVLCNYHSHVRGRYEVGHDLDELHDDIQKALASGQLIVKDAQLLYEARQFHFKPKYLKECRA